MNLLIINRKCEGVYSKGLQKDANSKNAYKIEFSIYISKS